MSHNEPRKVMNTNDDSKLRSFSLISDFKGDMKQLLATEFDTSLPALALRNMVLFPGVVCSVTVSRESSLNVVKKANAKDSLIAVLSQKDAEVDDPTIADLYEEGVAASVVKLIHLPDGQVSAVIQSYGPLRLEKLTHRRSMLRAEVTPLEEILPEEDDNEFVMLVEECRDELIKFLNLGNQLMKQQTIFAVQNISHPVFLVNFICTNMPMEQEEREALFKEHDVKQRAYKLLQVLNRQCQFALLRHEIQERTRAELDEQQREYFLSQQIKNIQEELGQGANPDIKNLEDKGKAISFPEKIKATYNRELEKLRRMNQQNPDYNVVLNYLQTMVDLPWGSHTQDNLNVKNAERMLNRDHFGMERVKERILEHLASLRFATKEKSPIICLYGPPGVGKTSLGRSIAEALGRKYVRISLGGVHDEAEIRGHRRTYVGAMPGRIIKGIIKAGSVNPLFVLDEIDKVSENNYNGDPHSALLEVLDPEQNSTFHDNYLDFDFDLSDVFFIATANNLQTIPRPLLDRMEIIEVEGYLAEEKREIARRHLIPKEQEKYDFGEGGKLKVSVSAIDQIVEHYTRESGVRQLEKQIDKLFRKVSYLTATNSEEKMPYAGQAIKASDVETLLGKPLFNRDKYQGNKYPGVVTGLAWTAVGGEILYIETSVSRSKGAKLTLTGNLGDVMKESAVLALEYIKAHASKLNIDYRIFDCWSVHIHVPEGATPKDGPSAGITIATSLASALTQRRVRDHIAMTGEITLRGRVLPVGGIKEKILAAKRAGITDILISEENRRDVEDINERYVKGLTFHYVGDVLDVLSYALLDEKVDNAIDLNAPLREEQSAKTEKKPVSTDVCAQLMKEKD